MLLNGSRGRRITDSIGSINLSVLIYIKEFFAVKEGLSTLEAAKIKSFAFYFAIAGLLGTLSSLTTIGTVDFSNPVNLVIVVVMPISLSLIAPMAIKYNSDRFYMIMSLYAFVVLCANNYVDASSMLDSTIFGMALVIVLVLNFSWQGMIVAMAGYTYQNIGFPEVIKWLSPETISLYNDTYYMYAVFDIITALMISSCVLVFRNELMNASALLEEEKIRSKMAERAKSDFLANMSHEIRTPMNGVVGMTALLANTQLDEKQKMFTNIITKSGNSLLTIINDILDFSKLDAGQMKLDVVPFDIHEALEDVAALFSSEIANKNVELILRVAPNVPNPVIGDVGRIRQVFMNLIGNAVKFTEEGHVYININCEVVEADETHVKTSQVAKLKIDVQDTGIGISKDKIDHVFNKFSQVDESATRMYQGTGLGLAISKQLVELMDGSMSLVSTEGEGSCFSFEIDLPVHENTIKRIMPDDLKGARIMIVEQNPLTASIRKERFTTWQLDAASVSSGRECIACLLKMHQQNVLPDLIVLSCQLQDMGGLEVVSEIRKRPFLSSIPILMLTAAGELDETEDYNVLGIQANLLKPWYSSILFETVLKVLQGEVDENAFRESQKLAS